MSVKTLARRNSSSAAAPSLRPMSPLLHPSRMLTTANELSLVAAVLIAGASAAGLWLRGLYKDSEAVAEMLRGYDLVTLAVVAPLLAVTLLPALRLRPRAQLVWLGMTAYAIYNYALYLFGSAFNAAFLAHVAIFTLSLYALALGLGQLNAAAAEHAFHPRTPVRVIASILVVLGAALGGMWIISSLQFAFTGVVPAEASKLVVPITMTHLGYTLDLTLLVPAYIVAGALLWRRQGWGFVLASMLLIAGFLQQVSYMAGMAFQAAADIPGATFDTAEPFIALAYGVAVVLLLVNVRMPRPAA